MLDILLGIIGMAIVICAFIAGVFFSKYILAKPEVFSSETDDLSEEEKEAKRKEMIAEQDAFKAQMTYGADMAYRIESEPEDGGLI